MMRRPPPSVFGDRYQPDVAVDRPPPPGRQAMLLALLLLGFLLMGIQLWLLTVALELYLGGHGDQIWLLALISGGVFLGGLLALRLVERRPRVARSGRPPV
jgi:hypothetical protein